MARYRVAGACASRRSRTRETHLAAWGGRSTGTLNDVTQGHGFGTKRISGRLPLRCPWLLIPHGVACRPVARSRLPMPVLSGSRRPFGVRSQRAACISRRLSRIPGTISICPEDCRLSLMSALWRVHWCTNPDASRRIWGHQCPGTASYPIGPSGASSSRLRFREIGRTHCQTRTKVDSA